jgi:hypothetical protein
VVVVVAVLASASGRDCADLRDAARPWTTANADHPGIAVAGVMGDGRKDVIATQLESRPRAPRVRTGT